MHVRMKTDAIDNTNKIEGYELNKERSIILKVYLLVFTMLIFFLPREVGLFIYFFFFLWFVFQ